MVPCEPAGGWLLNGAPGQADAVALRVGEEGEREPELGDVGGWHDRASAELLGFPQTGGRIVDLDVEAEMAAISSLGRADAPGDALRPGGHHTIAGTIAAVPDAPLEHRGGAALQGGSVLAGDLEPGNRWPRHQAVVPSRM